MIVVFQSPLLVKLRNHQVNELSDSSFFPNPAPKAALQQPKWYALYTRSRFEKKLLHELTLREMKAFLPMHEILSQWKDRKKKILVPIFPGYIFVNYVDTLENRHRVLNIPGAVCFVGSCGNVDPISEEQIIAIRRFLEANLLIDLYPYIQVGTQVEVISGPLAGVKGMLIEKQGKCRFVLQVDLIRQAISVEMDTSNIRSL